MQCDTRSPTAEVSCRPADSWLTPSALWALRWHIWPRCLTCKQNIMTTQPHTGNQGNVKPLGNYPKVLRLGVRSDRSYLSFNDLKHFFLSVVRWYKRILNKTKWHQEIHCRDNNEMHIVFSTPYHSRLCFVIFLFMLSHPYIDNRVLFKKEVPWRCSKGSSLFDTMLSGSPLSGPCCWLALAPR